MAGIWKREFTLENLNEFTKNTMVEHLDIEFTRIGDDFICATMPVDHRTAQPYGLLHGGASVALAETLGSMASYMALEDPYYSVGLEIKANHIKSITTGRVTGTTRPVHLGRTTHVWDISITNDANELICVSRITIAVLQRNLKKPDK